MVYIELYGLYWIVWFILNCMVYIELYGLYWIVWFTLNCLVYIELYGLYWIVWFILNCLVWPRRVRKVVTHKLFDKFTYEYDIALLQVHGDKLDFQVNMAHIQTFSDNFRQFQTFSAIFRHLKSFSDLYTFLVMLRYFSGNF